MFPIVSMRHTPVRFEARQPSQKRLEQLRDELVQQFPGGPFQHTNGSGIGLVGNYTKGDKRIGIVVYHEKAGDKKAVINHLLAQQLITPNPDGTYNYKKALVKFEVIGKIVAQ